MNLSNLQLKQKQSKNKKNFKDESPKYLADQWFKDDIINLGKSKTKSKRRFHAQAVPKKLERLMNRDQSYNNKASFGTNQIFNNQDSYKLKGMSTNNILKQQITPSEEYNGMKHNQNDLTFMSRLHTSSNNYQHETRQILNAPSSSSLNFSNNDQKFQLVDQNQIISIQNDLLRNSSKNLIFSKRTNVSSKPDRPASSKQPMSIGNVVFSQRSGEELFNQSQQRLLLQNLKSQVLAINSQMKSQNLKQLELKGDNQEFENLQIDLQNSKSQMLKTRRDIMKQFSPKRSHNSKFQNRNDQNVKKSPEISMDNLPENCDGLFAGKAEIKKQKARNNSQISDYTLKMSQKKVNRSTNSSIQEINQDIIHIKSKKNSVQRVFSNSNLDKNSMREFSNISPVGTSINMNAGFNNFHSNLSIQDEGQKESESKLRDIIILEAVSQDIVFGGEDQDVKDCVKIKTFQTDESEHQYVEKSCNVYDGSIVYTQPTAANAMHNSLYTFNKVSENDLGITSQLINQTTITTDTKIELKNDNNKIDILIKESFKEDAQCSPRDTTFQENQTSFLRQIDAALVQNQKIQNDNLQQQREKLLLIIQEQQSTYKADRRFRGRKLVYDISSKNAVMSKRKSAVNLKQKKYPALNKRNTNYFSQQNTTNNVSHNLQQLENIIPEKDYSDAVNLVSRQELSEISNNNDSYPLLSVNNNADIFEQIKEMNSKNVINSVSRPQTGQAWNSKNMRQKIQKTQQKKLKNIQESIEIDYYQIKNFQEFGRFDYDQNLVEIDGQTLINLLQLHHNQTNNIFVLQKLTNYIFYIDKLSDFKQTFDQYDSQQPLKRISKKEFQLFILNSPVSQKSSEDQNILAQTLRLNGLNQANSPTFLGQSNNITPKQYKNISSKKSLKSSGRRFSEEVYRGFMNQKFFEKSFFDDSNSFNRQIAIQSPNNNQQLIILGNSQEGLQRTEKINPKIKYYLIFGQKVHLDKNLLVDTSNMTPLLRSDTQLIQTINQNVTTYETIDKNQEEQPQIDFYNPQKFKTTKIIVSTVLGPEMKDNTQQVQSLVNSYREPVPENLIKNRNFIFDQAQIIKRQSKSHLKAPEVRYETFQGTEMTIRRKGSHQFQEHNDTFNQAVGTQFGSTQILDLKNNLDAQLLDLSYQSFGKDIILHSTNDNIKSLQEQAQMLQSFSLMNSKPKLDVIIQSLADSQLEQQDDKFKICKTNEVVTTNRIDEYSYPDSVNTYLQFSKQSDSKSTNELSKKLRTVIVRGSLGKQDHQLQKENILVQNQSDQKNIVHNNIEFNQQNEKSIQNDQYKLNNNSLIPEVSVQKKKKTNIDGFIVEMQSSLCSQQETPYEQRLASKLLKESEAKVEMQQFSKGVGPSESSQSFGIEILMQNSNDNKFKSNEIIKRNNSNSLASSNKQKMEGQNSSNNIPFKQMAFKLIDIGIPKKQEKKLKQQNDLFQNKQPSLKNMQKELGQESSVKQFAIYGLLGQNKFTHQSNNNQDSDASFKNNESVIKSTNPVWKLTSKYPDIIGKRSKSENENNQGNQDIQKQIKRLLLHSANPPRNRNQRSLESVVQLSRNPAQCQFIKTEKGGYLSLELYRPPIIAAEIQSDEILINQDQTNDSNQILYQKSQGVRQDNQIKITSHTPDINEYDNFLNVQRKKDKRCQKKKKNYKSQYQNKGMQLIAQQSTLMHQSSISKRSHNHTIEQNNSDRTTSQQDGKNKTLIYQVNKFSLEEDKRQNDAYSSIATPFSYEYDANNQKITDAKLIQFMKPLIYTQHTFSDNGQKQQIEIFPSVNDDLITNSNNKNFEDDEDYDESRDRMAIFSDYEQDRKVSINDVATSPMILEPKKTQDLNMSYYFQGHQFFAQRNSKISKTKQDNQLLKSIQVYGSNILNKQTLHQHVQIPTIDSPLSGQLSNVSATNLSQPTYVKKVNSSHSFSHEKRKDVSHDEVINESANVERRQVLSRRNNFRSERTKSKSKQILVVDLINQEIGKMKSNITTLRSPVNFKQENQDLAMIVKKSKQNKKEKIIDDRFIILGTKVIQKEEDKKLCEIQKMIKERIKNKYDYRFKKAQLILNQFKQ